MTSTEASTLSNPFLQPILDRARSRPDDRFGAFLIEGEWREVSQKAFLERALGFADAIRDLGVAPGELVFLIIDHGLDAPAAFIGTMLASAVPSFLPYPNVKQDNAAYWAQHRKIFERAEPRAIICFAALEAELRANVEDLGIPVLGADSAPAVASGRLPQALPHASDIALLQHSSGTTGLKKGVALSYEAIVRQLASYSDALGLDQVAQPVIASWLPLYHDMGLIAAFLQPVWAGVPIISIDPFDWVASPGLLLDAIETYRGTHVWLPNFAYIHIARRTSARRTWDLSSLEAVISCSEPCKPEAFDLFVDRFETSGVRAGMLQTCYAMAETVFAVSQSIPGVPPRRLLVDRTAIEEENLVRIVDSEDGRTLSLLSNGPCIEGCKVRVLGPDGDLGERRVGELCVTADFLFSGYMKNAEATARALVDGWYRTGDLGFIHDGELYVVGRIKDLIIVNGKNIYAHDVEASFGSIPGLKPGRAVAFGHYSQRSGSEQLVVIAEADGTDADSDAVASAVNRAVLAEVGIPCSDVRVVPQGWLIKTTSGKISRASNAEKYATMLKAEA